MANNSVEFDLTLAVKGFNTSLKKVDNSLKTFGDDFKKQAKSNKAAWSSFTGNLAASAVSFAVSGLANLTSGMVDFTKEAVLAAVNAEETTSKFKAVFSSIGDESDQMAKDLQKNYGLGVTESKELLSATGDLLTGFGFAQEGALDLSGEVQKVAVDLASFTNFSGGAKGASEAITKALLGERESMKALGVSIQEKDVKEQVAINTAKGLTFETDRQAKAQATLDIILRQSKNALGDYSRTSDGAANQLKLFEKRVEDLTIAFGENFLPILAPIIKDMNSFIETLDIDTLNGFVKSGLIFIIEGFESLTVAINPVIATAVILGNTFKVVFNALQAGVNTIAIAFAGLALGIVTDMTNLLNALPASLVPEGWVESMEETKESLTLVVDTLAESIIVDAQDMQDAFTNMSDAVENDVISTEVVGKILSRTDSIKKGILKANKDIETDTEKKDKKALEEQKKKDAENKTRQDGINAAMLKQSNFEEGLFGKQVSWEKAGGKTRADNLKSTLSTMATLSKSNNKTLAVIGKAAAISTATIDGFAAVQKALASAPPPFNFALAGVVGVATAANIASIAGVNFQHGGVVGGSSFAGDNVKANVNSGEMILNRGQQAKLFSMANGSSGNNGGMIEAINALGNRIANMEIVLVADDNQIATSASRGFDNGIVIGGVA